MQSESATENRAAPRGRRKKRGNGPADGPVFVDNSGRRSRLLRRIGTLVGVICLGYAVVLGMAFMGWGISVTPSQLFPFGNGQAGGAPGGGGYEQLQGGFDHTGNPPTGAPPTGAAPSPSASASTGAN